MVIMPSFSNELHRSLPRLRGQKRADAEVGEVTGVPLPARPLERLIVGDPACDERNKHQAVFILHPFRKNRLG